MTEKRPLALVLGRNQTSRLGMVHSAAAAGCDVAVVRTYIEKNMIAEADTYSRYVSSYHNVRQGDERGLMQLIAAYESEERPVILLPTDDHVAALLDHYLDRLSTHFLQPHVMQEQDGLFRLMDKSRQKELARQAGLPVAEGWVCSYVEGAYQVPDDVTFPCFTKPIDSAEGHLKQYQQRCDDGEQLAALLAKVSASYCGRMLVEAYHPIDRELAVLGVSMGERSVVPALIEMDCGLNGVMGTGRVLPIAPDLQAKLQAFMAQTQLTGLFDIDLYESEGVVYFNELNLRYGANGFALTHGGLNLPQLLIDHLVKGHADVTGSEAIETPYSFANEFQLQNIYLSGRIGFGQYQHLKKAADVRSLRFANDSNPLRMFSLFEWVMPLRRWSRQLKKKLRS